MAYIELRNITYKYPISHKPSLQSISMKLERGKIYGVIGRNGSGKTTLCNVLMRFCPNFYKGEFQGDILVEGQSIIGKEIGELMTRIGYIFQNPSNQMSGIKDTVYEEIAYGLENLGIERKEMIEKIDNVLKLLHITNLKDKNPFELSGGQQQKVAFASVIVMDPEILIIDEPVSQLDPQSADEIYDIIKYLKSKGKTIILVEQKIDLLMDCVDELVIMEEGKILIQDTLENVVNSQAFYEAGVRVPDFIKLFYKLNNCKYYFNIIPKTEEQFIEMLLKNKEVKKEKSNVVY